MKTYDYHLEDDAGVSTAFDQEMLIPIGTLFLHEFGLYGVSHYRDSDGHVTRITAKINSVICQRVKSKN